MKELEFRVWAVASKKMFLPDTDKNGFELVNGELRAMPNTIIMQYIGLKDKNGVKIYEGDILEAVVNNTKELRENGEPKCMARWTVEWKSFQNVTGFMVYGKDRRWNKLLTSNMIFNCNVQVIGNVYDNQEILSEVQDENRK